MLQLQIQGDDAVVGPGVMQQGGLGTAIEGSAVANHGDMQLQFIWPPELCMFAWLP